MSPTPSRPSLDVGAIAERVLASGLKRSTWGMWNALVGDSRSTRDAETTVSIDRESKCKWSNQRQSCNSHLSSRWSQNEGVHYLGHASDMRLYGADLMVGAHDEPIARRTYCQLTQVTSDLADCLFVVGGTDASVRLGRIAAATTRRILLIAVDIRSIATSCLGIYTQANTPIRPRTRRREIEGSSASYRYLQCCSTWTGRAYR